MPPGGHPATGESQVDAEHERELKLKMDAGVDHEDVLGLARTRLPTGWRIVRWVPWFGTDFYFDTRDGALRVANATFRVRRWKLPFRRKDGFKANFKLPPSKEVLYLDRTEVKSRIGVDEILMYVDDAMPGAAPRIALKFLDRLGVPREPPTLTPQVQITAFRNLYSVIPPGPVEMGASLLVIHFEEGTAFDIRDADVESWAREGAMVSPEPARSATLRGIEIELCTDASRPEPSAIAGDLFHEIAVAAPLAGLVPEPISKYVRASSALELARS